MCPCQDCLVLVRCKTKKFDILFKECELLKEYLIASTSTGHIQISEHHLYNYCSIMNIKVEKDRRNTLRLIYPE